MNISLPGSMKTWVDEQVKAGGYGTVSEFFRDLVREAKKRRVQEEIDRKLISALDGGDPVAADKKFWLKLRRDARKRLNRNGRTRR
jgi:antitoxin ParD1/3/4